MRIFEGNKIIYLRYISQISEGICEKSEGKSEKYFEEIEKYEAESISKVPYAKYGEKNIQQSAEWSQMKVELGYFTLVGSFSDF